MTTIELGRKYVVWGFRLFIFGLVIGYGPLAHYLHGAMEDVGPIFLKNVTLWWACPWTLACYVAQLGGLGMILVGLCYLVGGRENATIAKAAERAGLWLCVTGIIAEFVLGYAGYFVVNHIWYNFYFTPIQAGKNLWLGVQGISIAFYLAGIVLAYRSIKSAMQRSTGS
jgi:hypothetical protein